MSAPDSFLGRLDAGDAAALSATGNTRDYEPGDVLFREGDPGDSVVIVLAGHVKIVSTAADGREIVLGVRGPGELLGELSAIDGAPRSGSGWALGAVRALIVPRPAFQAFLDRTPRSAAPLLEVLARRVREASIRQLEFGNPDTLGRVAMRLVELADRHGRADEVGTEITLPLTQQELAEWTSLSREAVVKALQAMRRLGWIETGRRRITVLDCEALRERAQLSV
ncbi:MAG: Crp/Fnr family transcriptional regulator [Actinobacteria bacterium]|nr:Crp/Fnr family transcriptional regulator [Actinomycetota bacterium]